MVNVTQHPISLDSELAEKEAFVNPLCADVIRTLEVYNALAIAYQQAGAVQNARNICVLHDPDCSVPPQERLTSGTNWSSLREPIHIALRRAMEAYDLIAKMARADMEDFVSTMAPEATDFLVDLDGTGHHDEEFFDTGDELQENELQQRKTA
jgi:hypothetical protein